MRRNVGIGLVASAMLAISCTGVIGDDSEVAGGGGGRETTQQLCGVGPNPMRRLTAPEYQNTVRDLFGSVSVDVTKLLLPDVEIGGLRNNVTAQLWTLAHAQQYLSVADTVVADAVRDVGKVVGCDWTVKGESACAGDFITRFGKRAYRRPLTPAEESILRTVYDTGRNGADFKSGISATLTAMLMAPQFLYRLELQPGVARSDGAIPLSGYELASRLSYLFWGSMPDDELFAAAESGRLVSKADVRTQAERLLNSPRARPAIAAFHQQWLGLDGFASLAKDATKFPEFTNDLRDLMSQETQQFVDNVFWAEDGKLSTLLTAPYSFRNETLANYYGEPGPTGASMQKVATDPQRRAGLLTQGGFLTLLSGRDHTSPVHRGKFIRTRLFCLGIAPPPPGVNQNLPPIPEPNTARQRQQAHADQPACSSCHTLMDPIGLAMENYDTLGRWRTTESGLPIIVADELHGTDVDGAFEGVPGLVDKILKSEQVRSCVTATWFRNAHGRTETQADACALAELEKTYVKAGTSTRALLLALTQTDTFFYHSAAEGSSP